MFFWNETPADSDADVEGDESCPGPYQVQSFDNISVMQSQNRKSNYTQRLDFDRVRWLQWTRSGPKPKPGLCCIAIAGVLLDEKLANILTKRGGCCYRWCSKPTITLLIIGARGGDYAYHWGSKQPRSLPKPLVRLEAHGYAQNLLKTLNDWRCMLQSEKQCVRLKKKASSLILTVLCICCLRSWEQFERWGPRNS